MTQLRIAHLSDTHLGYEAYRAVTGDGTNQRGQDFIDAFNRVIDQITEWDPPLVIHSGDVIDRPQVPVRYLKAVSDGFARLASVRPDGTRRQVVVIEGNHDAPHSTREIAAVELLRQLPGVHVASTQTEHFRFNRQHHQDIADELDNIEIVAVPHDDLHQTGERASDRIRPNPDARISILTAHGIAGGSDLYQRGIGREHSISTNLLRKQWHYVALGHWHLRGPVGDTGTVWYAGSTENCGFGDLRDSGHKRGWLAITLQPDGTIDTIEPRNVPIRPMRQLEPINAEALDGEHITQLLVDRIEQAHREHPIDGAILNQPIDGARRHTWNLVDTQTARARAENATHYQITLRPGSGTPATGSDNETSSDTPQRGTVGIDLALERAAERLPKRRQKTALEHARHLLAETRHRGQTRGRVGTSRPRDTADN